jgi:GT2 family glycosyltransferase
MTAPTDSLDRRQTLFACEDVCAICVTYGRRVRLARDTVTATLVAGVGRVVLIANGCDAEINDELERGWDDRVVFVPLPTNQGSAGGFATGLRCGLGLTDAHMFWLLDDDNRPAPSALTALLENLPAVFDPARDAVVCLRPSRPQLVHAVDGSSSRARRSTYLGFTVLDLPGKVRRKFIGIGEPNGRRPGTPVAATVPYSPYGGSLLGRTLVHRIGIPDTRLVLYSDDVEFTSRITEAGGTITVVPQSIVTDAELSGLMLDLPTRRLSLLGWLEGDEVRTFYALRNRTYLDFRDSSRVSVLFIVNFVCVITLLAIAGLLRADIRRLRLVARAIATGAQERLGPDPRYPLE